MSDAFKGWAVTWECVVVADADERINAFWELVLGPIWRQDAGESSRQPRLADNDSMKTKTYVAKP